MDGRDIEETQAFLRTAWPSIRQALLDESYRPYPVLRVEISKPGGGVRQLGIPTVVDRLIQQAVCQILTPIFDPGFSASSFGFRPGRSAHDAVRQALAHQQDGREWMVDLDLKQFFDEVDYDILLARIGQIVVDGSTVKISPTGSSMMMGTPELMAQEDQFLKLLHASDTYQIIDGELELQNGEGRTVLIFVPRIEPSLTSTKRA